MAEMSEKKINKELTIKFFDFGKDGSLANQTQLVFKTPSSEFIFNLNYNEIKELRSWLQSVYTQDEEEEIEKMFRTQHDDQLIPV